jgi:putative FmdB family regulatory protein
VPIYEYICNKCGREFTALLMSSNKKVNCPTPGCESEDVKKKLSTFSCVVAGGTSGSSFGGGGG